MTPWRRSGGRFTVGSIEGYHAEADLVVVRVLGRDLFNRDSSPTFREDGIIGVLMAWTTAFDMRNFFPVSSMASASPRTSSF